MFAVSFPKAVIGRSILAGAAILAVGLGTLGTAEAFPAVATAPQAGVEATTVQYDGGYRHHRYRHHRHHDRYGMNRHARHPGHAGVYDCGPGGKATRLSRKACGGNDRFMHLNRY